MAALAPLVCLHQTPAGRRPTHSRDTHNTSTTSTPQPCAREPEEANYRTQGHRAGRLRRALRAAAATINNAPPRGGFFRSRRK